MKCAELIQGTPENWESGALGQEIEYAQVAPKELTKEVDDALGLQMISIRLEKDLIEKFKLIATINEMGYQALMKEALKRFAECEVKLILAQLAESKSKTVDNPITGKALPKKTKIEKKAA